MAHANDGCGWAGAVISLGADRISLRFCWRTWTYCAETSARARTRQPTAPTYPRLQPSASAHPPRS